MSDTRDIDALIDSAKSRLHTLADKTLELMGAETEAAMEEAYVEFGEYQKEEITKIFNRAVEEFYNAYTPTTYDRQNGLYDLLDIKTNDRGMVIANGPNYDELYNPDRLDSHRSSADNLYQTVFQEGWHGGAKTIDDGKTDIWGRHPSPGVAYYRKPGWVKYPGNEKKEWHRYGKWGRRAVRTEAPYYMISRELRAIEGTEMFAKFKEISNKHNEAAMQRVNAKIPQLMEEIL